MGVVKTQELANGNIGLEITYGGKECPFGGVDTSAPPAYIVPNCAASSEGFLVVDNKLVVTALIPFQTPTLFGGTTGVTILAAGSFYNSLSGLLNYVMGYKAAPFAGPPSGVNYTFYITAWNPSNLTSFTNDVLPVTLFDAVAQVEQASLELDCIASQVAAPGTGTGAVINITGLINIGNINTFTITTPGSGYGVNDFVQVQQGSNVGGWLLVTGVSGGGGIATATVSNGGDFYSLGPANIAAVEAASALSLVIVGPSGTFTARYPTSGTAATRQQIVTEFVTRAIGSSPDVTITASTDGYSIIITANNPGTTGNTITVQDTSTSELITNAPPFYFSARTARNLQGGQITQSASAPRAFNGPASVATVGGTVYFANLGPMILKYSGPGEFTTSTMYNGVGVIRKFAGSLIGLRLEGQLGTLTQNADMIFAWSAGDDLDEWSPLTSTGNVTGAGFEQIADIGDYLSGLFVTNSTAYIIRAQGVSYATATGNASLPYDVNHIGLGDSGEGSQISALCAQYDQVGVYVGNSNIYEISGSFAPVGNNIKSDLFATLASAASSITAANACATSIGGDETILAGFYIANSLYLYSVQNKTWAKTTLNIGNFANINSVVLCPFATEFEFANSGQFNQNVLGLVLQLSGTVSIWSLSEQVPNGSNALAEPVQITFPVEEISFGRDITIDALYVALWGNVTVNTVVNFLINGQQYASVTLTAANFNTLAGKPTELQIFPTTFGAGAFTAKSPQLSIQIPSTTSGKSQIRFSKIAIFASFDPKQRPV